MWLIPLPEPACGLRPVSPVDSGLYTYRLCLSLPALTRTASTPMFDVQLKLPGVPLDDWTKLEIVTVRVPSLTWLLPGGSDFSSVQAPKSPQVGLLSLEIGVGVTLAARAGIANAAI